MSVLTAVAAAAPIAESAVLAVLRVADPLRRQALAGAFPTTASAPAAEVMVVDLHPGQGLPDDARAFEGALLVLTDDPAVAAQSGIAGVLPARATPRQVAAAVAALAEGLTVRTPCLSEPPGFATPERPARKLLTPREVEVLAAVGQGMSNKAIARRLGISAHTVKYHLEAIYAKLDVRSRAEAVTRGLRLGVQVL